MKTFVATVFALVISTTFLLGQQLQTKQAPLPCLNKKFSIVVHIVKDSLGNTNVDLAQIENSIDTLNVYFEPICVSFEVCDVREIDNFRYDFLRNQNEWSELQVQYHEKSRINLFFVEDIAFEPFACGFATPSGINILDEGGILIKKNPACFFPGNTAIPHEMGHYFGLLDTYEGNGIELVDGSNCETEGDQICDTPADPYTEGQLLEIYIDVSLGCRFIYTVPDANGQNYIPHVGNIMSFYPNSCHCGFTYGQYVRMANTCLSGEGRMW
ncbi:MAG: M43 family zinc metalloprotease [Bacteroidota bacterium]